MCVCMCVCEPACVRTFCVLVFVLVSFCTCILNVCAFMGSGLLVPVYELLCL